MISKRVQKMDSSGIRKAFELVQKLKNPIDLSIGQPDFDIPKNIKKVAIEVIKNNKNKYSPTQGIEELRMAIAKKLKKEKQINHQKENIIITGAVSGGLSVVLPTLIDCGDEVIIFDPSFVGYKQLILLYGGKPRIVERNKDFSINFKNLEKAVTKKTKAIIFSTPENPTGYVYKEEELKKLAQIAQKNDLVVLSDEIYADFVYEGQHISIGRFYDKTVVLGGFSKSQAMMGWRVGYLSAPTEIIENALKIQQFTFVCAPTPFQYATIEALKTKNSQIIKEYKKRRDLVYNGLKDKYEIIKPQGAFYFFIKYPFKAEDFIQKCLDNNLIVVPGSSFSQKNTHFRICYATSWKKLEEAVEIFNRIAK
ncbi:MAG: aminotransferase class I/II-fold pyridoxal phosphate-dependent enzyme [Parcubacteria group bacterium]|jgi:aspartate aminotransferase/aminotransferase